MARDEARLEETARQIRAAAGVRVQVLRADLSVPDDVARVAERLATTGGPDERPVGLLVNNAGFATHQHFVGATSTSSSRRSTSWSAPSWCCPTRPRAR